MFLYGSHCLNKPLDLECIGYQLSWTWSVFGKFCHCVWLGHKKLSTVYLFKLDASFFLDNSTNTHHFHALLGWMGVPKGLRNLYRILDHP